MTYALLTIGTILFITFVISYVILRMAVQDRTLRRFLLFFVILTPPVAIFAFARSLFGPVKRIGYSEVLGRIEDEIENERAQLFDEKIMHPSFSQRWKMSYLYAIEKSAVTAARLDRSVGASLCGIAQPH